MKFSAKFLTTTEDPDDGPDDMAFVILIIAIVVPLFLVMALYLGLMARYLILVDFCVSYNIF